MFLRERMSAPNGRPITAAGRLDAPIEEIKENLPSDFQIGRVCGSRSECGGSNKTLERVQSGSSVSSMAEWPSDSDPHRPDSCRFQTGASPLRLSEMRMLTPERVHQVRLRHKKSFMAQKSRENVAASTNHRSEMIVRHREINTDDDGLWLEGQTENENEEFSIRRGVMSDNLNHEKTHSVSVSTSDIDASSESDQNAPEDAKVDFSAGGEKLAVLSSSESLHDSRSDVGTLSCSPTIDVEAAPKTTEDFTEDGTAPNLGQGQDVPLHGSSPAPSTVRANSDNRHRQQQESNEILDNVSSTPQPSDANSKPNSPGAHSSYQNSVHSSSRRKSFRRISGVAASDGLSVGSFGDCEGSLAYSQSVVSVISPFRSAPFAINNSESGHASHHPRGVQPTQPPHISKRTLGSGGEDLEYSLMSVKTGQRSYRKKSVGGMSGNDGEGKTHEKSANSSSEIHGRGGEVNDIIDGAARKFPKSRSNKIGGGGSSGATSGLAKTSNGNINGNNVLKRRQTVDPPVDSYHVRGMFVYVV